MLTGITPLLNNFLEVLAYGMYRSRKKSQHFYVQPASNVAKFFITLRAQLGETKFDESDLVFLLAFLSRPKEAWDSIGVH